MILTEVRNYLQQHGHASVRDIALHVDADNGAVRGILDHLTHKGRVRKIKANSACGTSCCKCDAGIIAVYVWGAQSPPERAEPSA